MQLRSLQCPPLGRHHQKCSHQKGSGSTNTNSHTWKDSSMCYNHYMYRIKVRSCKPPCTHMEN